MIEAEGLENVIPDARSVDEAEAVYYRFYKPEDEKKQGVIGITLFPTASDAQSVAVGAQAEDSAVGAHEPLYDLDLDQMMEDAQNPNMMERITNVLGFHITLVLLAILFFNYYVEE